MMVCRDCGEEVRFFWQRPLTSNPDMTCGGEWTHRAPTDHVGVPVIPPPESAKPVEIPPPEIPAHDVDPAEFGNRSGIKIVINALLKSKTWELISVRHARGPYMGSKGEVLSISDLHVVKGRELDTGRVIVGTWRDGAFDRGYIGKITDRVLKIEPANSNDMRAWIKGDLPDPLG